MVFLLFPHCKRKVQKCVYTLWGSDTAIHPPENFAKKGVLNVRLVEPFSGHCLPIKS